MLGRCSAPCARPMRLEHSADPCIGLSVRRRQKTTSHGSFLLRNALRAASSSLQEILSMYTYFFLKFQNNQGAFPGNRYPLGIPKCRIKYVGVNLTCVRLPHPRRLAESLANGS